MQKYVNYTKQRLETIPDMKYEVEEVMILKNVEYEIVVVWVHMTK